MAKFDGYQFQRECYLRSVPSVDLDKVTSDKPVNCSEHTLEECELNAILRECGVLDERGEAMDDRLYTACLMWVVQSGPCIIDKQAA